MPRSQQVFLHRFTPKVVLDFYKETEFPYKTAALPSFRILRRLTKCLWPEVRKKAETTPVPVRIWPPSLPVGVLTRTGRLRFVLLLLQIGSELSHFLRWFYPSLTVLDLRHHPLIWRARIARSRNKRLRILDFTRFTLQFGIKLSCYAYWHVDSSKFLIQSEGCYHHFQNTPSMTPF